MGPPPPPVGPQSLSASCQGAPQLPKGRARPPVRPPRAGGGGSNLPGQLSAAEPPNLESRKKGSVGREGRGEEYPSEKVQTHTPANAA